MVYRSPFPPVPICNENLAMKMLQAIWHHGTVHPDKKAIITASDTAKSVTFHKLHSLAHSVRAFLRGRGFGPGDMACLVLSNCLEWVIFQLGALAAGGAISGASALFTYYELERQFVDSQCSLILTDEDNLDQVMNAAQKCERIKTIICIRSEESDGSPLPDSIIEWADVVACRPEYDIPSVDPESLAVLPYSSGTTGPAKGVMLSHRAIGTMIDIFLEHFKREIFSVIGPENYSFYDETSLVYFPLYHMLGFGMLNNSLLAGATAVMMGRFDPEIFLSAIAKYRVVLCGAAPAGKDACMEFLSQHKNVKYLCQAYGMTECTMGSHLPVLNVKDPYMGVGKAASNMVDVSTGKEVGEGERGEIWVRSPTLMMGYLNRHEATVETLDKDGWLHTGDIGYMDADGRLYIVDRLKELIKVAPAELEDLLLSHPKIKDAAVIGIPDPKVGELVRAYVDRVDDTLTEEDVIKFVAEKVSRYKHITGGVKFVPDIPKSPSGKILRKNLREEVEKEIKSKI